MSGVYVTVFPDKVTVPFAGAAAMLYVSTSPSTSVAIRLKDFGVSSFVVMD